MKALALLCLLLPLSALAVPPIGSNNKLTVTGSEVVFADGGTYAILIKQGGASTAARGLCFDENGTNISCSLGFTAAASTGSITVTAATLAGAGTIDWTGAIITSSIFQSGRAGSSGPAFNAAGVNSYSNMGMAITAGLPASSATTAGGYTFNTDAGVPMFNDGAAWKFFSSGTSQSAVYMNALLAAATTFGGEALGPTNRSYYAVAGRVLTAGTNGGGTTIALTASDGVGTCTAALPCTSGTGTNFNLATTGTCAFSAGASITYATGASGCTVNPTILGNVYFQSN